MTRLLCSWSLLKATNKFQIELESIINVCSLNVEQRTGCFMHSSAFIKITDTGTVKRVGKIAIYVCADRYQLEFSNKQKII